MVLSGERRWMCFADLGRNRWGGREKALAEKQDAGAEKGTEAAKAGESP